ncbi:hypothetical protein H6P81_019315 [Aristolochia fimbriata]|uniref:Uncharacterized protein n=1 Tax=Aristolochia fimbriata TaxID=158543 RepID=A0AAV7DSV5_ARIFI|nr:hypothetical protein H6P81_019315 [Aristolochia fimbriata]
MGGPGRRRILENLNQPGLLTLNKGCVAASLASFLHLLEEGVDVAGPKGGVIHAVPAGLGGGVVHHVATRTGGRDSSSRTHPSPLRPTPPALLSPLLMSSSSYCFTPRR